MKTTLLILLFALTSFIAWNYFGLLFIINTIILFYFIDYLKNVRWYLSLTIIYILFLSLNISATFWLYNIDFSDSILIFIANSLFMLIFFCATIYLAKKTKYYPFFFIFIWVCGEWLLSKWDLAWPWLNFGNVLSNQWYLIKWYSYIGSYGGSVWILLVGFYIYSIILKKDVKKNIVLLILLFLLPAYSSIDYLFSKENITNKTQVLCYIPHFNSNQSKTNYSKTKFFFRYVKKNKIPNIILTPELFYSKLYPTQFKNGDISFFFKEIFKKNPNATFFIGTEINNSSKIKFNGMSVVSKDNILFRTKKKYVPINEYTTKLLVPFMGESYYSKNNIDDSKQIKKAYKIFPFVCYESLFPSFFAKNSINTNLVFLSTSEAFLNKSYYGKNQYLNLIRIRAIENGRYIVKCSNDGTSCVINPNGKIEQYIENEFQNISIPKIKTNTVYQKIMSFL